MFILSIKVLIYARLLNLWISEENGDIMTSVSYNL